ncbi:hypothetical protein L1A08_15940 [Rubinisphaera sp. ICM_H10]|nr:hypothetical protein [Rubinisphaera margarita]
MQEAESDDDAGREAVDAFGLKGLLTVALIVIAVHTTNCYLSPPVSQSKLDSLSVGMELSEVELLLGAPQHRIVGVDGSTVLRYSSKFRSGWIDVFFERNGRYTEYNYEQF